MIPAVVCHAPDPHDRLEDFRIRSVRVDFRAAESDQEITGKFRRFVDRPQLGLFLLLTSDTTDADRYGWHAVRCFHAAEGLGLLGRLDGVEIGNEIDKQAFGPWSQDPLHYGDVAIAVHDKLRRAGCEAPIYTGGIANVSVGNTVNRLLASLGYREYQGLDYLRRVLTQDLPWDLDIAIHRYNTADDPAEPAPGHRTLENETQAIMDTIGNRRLAVTELPSESTSMIYTLERFQNLGADIGVVFTWCDGDPADPRTATLPADGLVTFQREPKQRAFDLADWIATQEGDE